MPNNVTNELFLSGPASRIKEFLEQAKTIEPRTGQEIPFSFTKFVPPPSHPDYGGECDHNHYSYKDGVGDPHYNCWYSWNTNNWDTKWDCYDVTVNYSEPNILDRLVSNEVEPTAECRVVFDTAWSPPFKVIDRIRALFPEIVCGFRWMDEDMHGSGGGYFKLKNGVVVDTKTGINDPHGKDGPLWWWLVRDLKEITELCND